MLKIVKQQCSMSQLVILQIYSSLKIHVNNDAPRVSKPQCLFSLKFVFLNRCSYISIPKPKTLWFKLKNRSENQKKKKNRELCIQPLGILYFYIWGCSPHSFAAEIADQGFPFSSDLRRLFFFFFLRLWTQIPLDRGLTRSVFSYSL